MKQIKGKFKQLIYQNSSNAYIVALFKVSETEDKDLKEYINKTITVTGIISDLKFDIPYTLEGSLEKHPKYSWQFVLSKYEIEKPTSIDAMINFLASPFVEGCGKETAKKIVELYGVDSLNKIKEDFNNLLKVKGLTTLRAMKIYNSVLNFEKNDDIILKLEQLGFSLEDASRILSKHEMEIEAILEGNLYLLKDIFEFSKLDHIYCNNFEKESPLRCKECILDAMMQISFNEGSTFYAIEEIYKALQVLHNLNVNNEDFLNYIEELTNDGFIVKEDKKYYLYKYYEEELLISHRLREISHFKLKRITKLDEKIAEFEKEKSITYNDEQKRAIKEGLRNNISIISGGPGTGKTTIINAIVNIYIKSQMLAKDEIFSDIALLAPTGRASKRLALSTGLMGSTIHRHLKWHKEEDCFEYDENNRLPQKLIIVDESSMIDVSLMKSLLCALNNNVRLILVGDIYQLPSVGPGLVLQDLINSDLFSFTELTTIYRQSDNSYIPFLAKDIKNQNIDEEFMYKKDDYNFVVASDEDIMGKIVATAKYGLSKGINEDNMQILAPMYKGINGIDNLNIKLQEVYNPENDDKNELAYGDKIYRENDKVLQLINDSEKNVFNGDIGKIVAIYKDKDKRIMIDINFDGSYVTYEKKDLKNITHAYAITVHKSQGSEFEHVIMPISKSYYIMLYNKLLYTGVSRAKKSLTLIGEPRAFTSGIQNNYSKERKTSLISNLQNDFYE